ncbi:Aminomethyltransferase (glycine cleavage system T protein) [Candidatus Syntrophocurvum alkaliphilum]|uniref:Aminomethyltransferase n=1 Tax=Candidatus Syntrophocurvum alkaliphilum TaxID=2293317 RepID=A0A6I6DCL6_9FIRM|nr:glycine cleavage system aminomethyltransferase GcvT [Candidatus Syntrophocurvum alkaliphilum]QGT98880.1 Aminomethyltransferase (glycine cleavage system T protein) [Candidatus Syntrophocurvum alkaliphilum]
MSLKRTPLFTAHQKSGGKLIDFGGWELPVQYEGIIKEHMMVRNKAGLFDVSHMGEIEIKGENAEKFIQYLMTNNITTLKDNQIQYTFMCYENGGVVDDLLVYRYSNTHYLLVVNASNKDKDYEWIKKHAIEGVEIKDTSDSYAQLAIQGPLAEDILQKLTKTDLKTIKFFWFDPEVEIAGAKTLVSRTGYTGEDGFEIYTRNEDAVKVWDAILEAGKDDIAPIGLGARDTLRFEAKLPLYGQEIDQDITPLEAGLGFFVKLDSDDFIGKDALVKQKEANPDRILVEFEMIDKGIARSKYEVEKDGVNIGWVTTGSHSPTFEKSIGLALIKREYFTPGEEINIIIRNRKLKAKLTKGSFYKKNTKK